MFFIDNFEDHGPSGMDYCFGWVLKCNNLGLVFSCRLSIIYNHSICDIGLRQKQEIRMDPHIYPFFGVSNLCLCPHYRK